MCIHKIRKVLKMLKEDCTDQELINLIIDNFCLRGFYPFYEKAAEIIFINGRAHLEKRILEIVEEMEDKVLENYGKSVTEMPPMKYKLF